MTPGKELNLEKERLRAVSSAAHGICLKSENEVTEILNHLYREGVNDAREDFGQYVSAMEDAIIRGDKATINAALENLFERTTAI